MMKVKYSNQLNEEICTFEDHMLEIYTENYMKIIKNIVDNWDPIDILTFSPNDEYHSEISEIEQLLCTTNNVLELGDGIYHIFLRSFGEDVFHKSKSECIIIAREIMEALLQ